MPVAPDLPVNTLFGGRADGTISSAAWRKRNEGRGWALLDKLIDGLFFRQPEHGKTAYESEPCRKQLPPEPRGI